jgi:Right handed beta helix region
MRSRLWRVRVPLVLAGVLCVSCSRAQSADGTPLPRLVSGTRPVTDTTSPVTVITITAPSLILEVGDSAVVTGTARDSMENALPGRRVVWRSDWPQRAAVSVSGIVYAVSAGTTALVASAGGVEQRIAVTVHGRDTVIRIAPGDDIQAAVRRAPDGATFRLLAGVHARQSIVPRDGMSFIGERGAILDGGAVVPFAFRGDSGANVTLRHLVIRRYAPPVQDGAVHADGADGWIVDSCDVGDNAAGGIRLGDHMRVTNSVIHDNAQIGILGSGAGVLIDGNEIARNNPKAKYDMYWEAGGTKFVRMRDLVVRRNFVHHNRGPGLWTDIDNVRTLYEGNRVEDNAEAGIFHEISYAAVIRNNVVRRNGSEAVPKGGVTGAGILVSVSSDVDVAGNTVEGNRNGIIAIQDRRGAGAFGAYALRNVWVHDNRMPQQGGTSGVVVRGWRSVIDRATRSARGNRVSLAH